MGGRQSAGLLLYRRYDDEWQAFIQTHWSISMAASFVSQPSFTFFW
jgi:hypothetical protein